MFLLTLKGIKFWIILSSILFVTTLALVPLIWAQDDDSSSTISTIPDPALFDDTMQLDGHSRQLAEEPMDILLAMIKDDTLMPYQTAAAVRVFREKFSQEIFSRDKILAEKSLLRRLNLSDSSFVQVEIMHTLCLMNRYKYFNSMVPALFQKLDHYNKTVNDLAFSSLSEILEKGSNKTSEARVVFNTLRKMLFLSRKRLAEVKEPDARLRQKIELLRWSIKILGTEELKRLPSEVIRLL